MYDWCLRHEPSIELVGAWPRLAESPRLAVIIDEQLVWSPREGNIRRPFVRVIEALTQAQVEVVIVSDRTQVGVVRTGVPLIEFRPAPEGQVAVLSVGPPATTRTLAGSIALLEFLWWISRRRDVTRVGAAAAN